MSESDIGKGERWSAKVGRELESHRVGVICVTPENMASQWLLFEAGALSRMLDEAKVCPLLLGIRADEVTGPLVQFQATVFEREEMLALARSLNEQLGNDAADESVLVDAFDKFWPELENRMEKVASIKVEANSVPLVIQTFAKYGLPEPSIGSIAHFDEGFESHSLYGTACSVATQRLYVYGRKNRKLFDKEHSDFFRNLKSRVDAGFDFRCLFLDPDAPEHVIRAAHQDSDFAKQLSQGIRRAVDMLKAHSLDPKNHFRAYSLQRTSAAMIVDDAVLYTPVHMTSTGSAAPLTKGGFSVVNSRAALGKEIKEEFKATWEAGRVLTEETAI